MKVEVFDGQTRQPKRCVVQKRDLANTTNALDCFFRRSDGDVQIHYRSGVKGDAATARVQDEVEAIGIIIHPSPHQNNPSVQHRE